MMLKYIFSIFTFLLLVFNANSQEKQSVTVQPKQVSENAIYQLFPTQNYWTFLKLDTRNGKLWQVHYTISKDDFQGEVILNSYSLVWDGEEETIGRFTLYPTNNIYNFILLDQINGKTYQVQWNSEQEKRFVSRIN